MGDGLTRRVGSFYTGLEAPGSAEVEPETRDLETGPAGSNGAAALRRRPP